MAIVQYVGITAGVPDSGTGSVKTLDGIFDVTSGRIFSDAFGSIQAKIADASGSTVTFNANGQATAANSAPVVQASNTSFAYGASATFTPGATTHAANSVVGAAAEIDF